MMYTFNPTQSSACKTTNFTRRSTLAIGLAAMLCAASLPCSAGIPSAAAATPSAYDIEEIVNLGGNDARAYAINNAGAAVGYSMPRDCCAHAFNSSLSPLFLNEAPSYARGINAGGVVAGDIDVSGGGGCYHAAQLWPHGVVDFVDYDKARPDACSNGISFNSAGELLGQRYGKTPGDPRRAMKYSNGRWDELDLPAQLPYYGTNSHAGGMNDFGEVVGFRERPEGTKYDMWRPGGGFYWDRSIRVADLNVNLTYPPRHLPFEIRTANAINNHHWIVGFSGIDLDSISIVSAYKLERTKYDAGSGTIAHKFYDLGTLPNGGISYALGLNSGGDAIVGAAYRDASGAGNYTATLFTHNRVIDLYADLSLYDRLHWTLAEATGINDHGVITGWGVHDGVTRAFILKPHAHITVKSVGGSGGALLTISGSGFYGKAPVTIEVREGDIGGALVVSHVAAASTQGAFTWPTFAKCGKDLAVNAWDGESGAFSNMVVVNVPCV